MVKFKISSTDIEISLRNIISNMGYGKENIPNGLEEALHPLYKKFLEIIEPECGYIIPSNKETEYTGNGIVVNKIQFNTGRKIASKLKGIEGVFLFVVTIGNGIDVWIRKLVDEDDIYSAYLVDVIASEYVEKLSDWIEDKIKNKFGDSFGFTDRYGPGYCEWDLAEQGKLFSFFPKGFCGITLTESSLMKPRKSLSGIMGFGEFISRSELPCDVCPDFNCHKNVNKKTK